MTEVRHQAAGAAVLLAVAALAACVARTAPVPVVFPGAAGTAPEAGTADAGDPALGAMLDALFTARPPGPVLWGVEVRSLDRNERLYARNHDVLLTPASTMKIVTLAAAAERLGWDDRFETTLAAAAPIRDGTLGGDLVVRGTGDPTINAPGTEDLFAAWAGALRARGVRRIAGRIVGDDDPPGDDNAAPDAGFGAGWAWDDLALGFAAPAGALQHHENVVHVVVAPADAAGVPGRVQIRTPSSGLTLVNDVVTAAAGEPIDIRLLRAPRQDALVVTGQIPRGSEPAVRTAAVDNPTRFFVRALRNALERHGITVGGEAIDIDRLDAQAKTAVRRGLHPLVRHRSDPLSAIARGMMKRSQNLYAESMLLRLGAAAGRGGRAGGGRAGRRVAGRVLAGWGVGADRAIVADGSGLSRYNYLTAGALVEVLARVYHDPRHRERFLATLPVAGRDGTLRRRMVGTAAEGVVRAKTGSLTRVRGLAGFAETAGGETVAFAILANNFSAAPGEVIRVIDDAVAALAAFSGAGPSPSGREQAAGRPSAALQRVGEAGLSEAPGPETATVAPAARPSVGRRVVAAMREAVVEPQSVPPANDLGLCHRDERGVDAEPPPFDARLRRERGETLERRDVLGPAVRVAGVVERVDADDEVARAQRLGPGERQRQQYRVARRDVRRGNPAGVQGAILRHRAGAGQRRPAEGGKVYRQLPVPLDPERRGDPPGRGDLARVDLAVAHREGEEPGALRAGDGGGGVRIEPAAQQDDGAFRHERRHGVVGRTLAGARAVRTDLDAAGVGSPQVLVKLHLHPRGHPVAEHPRRERRRIEHAVHGREQRPAAAALEPVAVHDVPRELVVGPVPDHELHLIVTRQPVEVGPVVAR